MFVSVCRGPHPYIFSVVHEAGTAKDVLADIKFILTSFHHLLPLNTEVTIHDFRVLIAIHYEATLTELLNRGERTTGDPHVAWALDFLFTHEWLGAGLKLAGHYNNPPGGP